VTSLFFSCSKLLVMSIISDLKFISPDFTNSSFSFIVSYSLIYWSLYSIFSYYCLSLSSFNLSYSCIHYSDSDCFSRLNLCIASSLAAINTDVSFLIFCNVVVCSNASWFYFSSNSLILSFNILLSEFRVWFSWLKVFFSWLKVCFSCSNIFMICLSSLSIDFRSSNWVCSILCFVKRSLALLAIS